MRLTSVCDLSRDLEENVIPHVSLGHCGDGAETSELGWCDAGERTQASQRSVISSNRFDVVPVTQSLIVVSRHQCRTTSSSGGEDGKTAIIKEKRKEFPMAGERQEALTTDGGEQNVPIVFFKRRF